MCLSGALICAGAMGFALYLQYVQQLEPCPMCVLQRVAMIGSGLVFLVAAAHGPSGRGQWLYAGFAASFALLGLVIAGRHVWLQSLPADQVPACGPALNYLMDIMPVWEVVQTILRGDGNCAVIAWKFVGLSLPAWTGIGFFLLAGWAVMCVLLPKLLGRIHGGQVDAGRRKSPQL
jgi:disulfide bond formation protein DsbB